MYFKFKLIFAFLCANLYLYAQDSINFILQKEYSLKNKIAWNIDKQNNLIISDLEYLKKIDFNGNLLFSESFKKIGRIDEIDTKNPLKILLFSEEQQTIFTVDNTLTKQNEIALEEYNINFGTHISSSIQSDKLWVYDQQNSKLVLIANKEGQSIFTNNLAGLFEIKNVFKITELNNQLIIGDSKKGLFIFDLYGTFKQHLNFTDLNWFYLNEEFVYLLLNKNELIAYNLETGKTKKVYLPEKEVIKFEINQRHIFLETKDKIRVFLIETR